MASLTDATDGELTEFKGRLGRAGFSREIIRAVNRSDGNALATFMFDELMKHPCFALVHGLFLSPEQQIARVRELNLDRGWGFSAKAFATAEKSIPVWPKDKLVAVTLVPYLGDVKNEEGVIVMSGLERTFHELWACATSAQVASYRWDGYVNAGPKRLRLLKGIEHKPGLRWEVIDLGCNRNKKPMEGRGPEKSPHAGILASAMLHPEWIRAMDGTNVPYVLAPGYEVDVSGGLSWRYVPSLGFDRDDRKIRLDYGWYGNDFPYWAVPSLVRE